MIGSPIPHLEDEGRFRFYLPGHKASFFIGVHKSHKLCSSNFRYTIGGNYNKAWSLCHGFGNHKSRGPFTHSKENLSESFFRIINIFINGDGRSTTQDYLAQIIKSESRPAFTRSRNFVVLKQGWRQTNRISKFGVFMKLNYLSANSGCKPNIGGGYKIIFFRNSFWSIRLLLAGPREKA